MRLHNIAMTWCKWCNRHKWTIVSGVTCIAIANIIATSSFEFRPVNTVLGVPVPFLVSQMTEKSVSCGDGYDYYESILLESGDDDDLRSLVKHVTTQKGGTCGCAMFAYPDSHTGTPDRWPSALKYPPYWFTTQDDAVNIIQEMFYDCQVTDEDEVEVRRSYGWHFKIIRDNKRCVLLIREWTRQWHQLRAAKSNGAATVLK